jgi:TM2 domain-containing membrane protein YozV
MTTEVCPYCRAPILADEPARVCEGCGTKHHSDCYAENNGCTIFGCCNAPAEEPKVTVSAPEITAAPVARPVAAAVPPSVAPPPPPGKTPEQSMEELRQISSHVVPSMFSLFGPENEGLALENEPDLLPPSGPPKNRTTFIVLGALLGALGAHNFYAGHTKKAIAQLAITVVTLGFGSPMSWIWAIIDICTVNQDRYGVQFES